MTEDSINLITFLTFLFLLIVVPVVIIGIFDRPTKHNQYDFNDDQKVDMADVSIIMHNFTEQ